MAEVQTLARPYARAVFELASADAATAQWSAALKSLAQLVQMPQIVSLIGHPALTRRQLAGLLSDALGDQGTPQLRALLALLSENHRLRLLPAIAAQYEALKAVAESRIDIEITTAVKVQDAQAQRLTDAIQRRLKKETQVHWAIDQSLIGGARIRAGDTVVDGSLKGELVRLAQTLVN